MKMKKILSLLIASSLSFGLAACSSKPADAPGTGSSKDAKTIGIAMPTKSSQRWIDDGNNVVKELEKLGYKANLQYAEDVVENQVSQIENMITKGVDLLIVACIDGEALTDVLAKAKDANIPVISYDRLIRNTDAISYYATFDNFKVGVLQGEYIEKALGLKEGKGPFNIELFAGSPDDNNSNYFFKGAMSILQPYIDSGKLVVKSGQTDFNQVATLRWDGATAQSRMDNILSKNYTKDKLHAVLSPYDGISIGVISSLKGVGYGTPNQPMPIVTGQDAEIPSIKSIIKGEQTQTVFKDTRELAKRVVKMADAILTGKEVEVNDTKTYNNGVKVVPSYLCVPVSVDKNNYEKELIETGYYTKEQLAE